MTQLVRTNFPEFIRELRHASRLVQTRAARRAMSEGAAVYRDAVRGEAPRKSGRLAKAIYVGRLARRQKNEVGYTVAIRSGKRYQSVGKKQANRDAYYAYFVHEGHLVRVKGDAIRGGRRRAALERRRARAAGALRVQPNRFILRGFRRASGAALRAIENRMAVEVRKIDAEV